MTFSFNGGFPSAQMAASEMDVPLTNGLNRKRKDMDETDDDQQINDFDRQSAFKGLRKFASMSKNNGGDEQAQFHPLPSDLNIRLLTNLGYIDASHQMQYDSGSSSRPSHSPTSSFSDFGGPSTPIDFSSAESYFTKGMRRESEAEYPDFNFYPTDDNRPRTPGLLGMHMEPPSVGSQDANGMQVDGMEDVVPDAPKHGSHCRSIPQLHVRSEPGISSELWASCADCGSYSKVDCAPIGDSLSYSP